MKTRIYAAPAVKGFTLNAAIAVFSLYLFFNQEQMKWNIKLSRLTYVVFQIVHIQAYYNTTKSE